MKNGLVGQSKSPWKKLWIFFIVASVSIYYIFSPVIIIPFHHHDTYKNSLSDGKQSCSHDIGNGFNHNLSRHIAADTECGNFKYARTLTSMSVARLLDVFVIGLTIALLSVWLYTIGFSFWGSLFASGTLFVLPALQTDMLMAAHHLALTLLFAMIAALFVQRSHLYLSKNKLPADLILLAASIFFLMTSLFTYPSLSSFFLIPMLFLVLFSSPEKWLHLRKYLVLDIIIFCISAAVFFIIAKHHAIATGQTNVGGYHYDPNLNIFNRLPQLLALFPNQAALYDSTFRAVVIYIIMLGGVCIAIYQFISSNAYKTDKKQSIYLLLQRIIAVIALFIVGSLVFLVSPEINFFKRVTHVFYVMSVIAVIWALSKWSFWKLHQINKASFTFILGILFLVNATTANYFSAWSALNDNYELNFIVNNIADYMKTHKNQLLRIHIIQSNKSSITGFDPADDIFNINSLTYLDDVPNIVVTALQQLARPNSYSYTVCSSPVRYSLLQERKCINSAPKNNIVITFSREGESFYITPKMLIIDMNVLNPLAEKTKPELKNVKF